MMGIGFDWLLLIDRNSDFKIYEGNYQVNKDSYAEFRELMGKLQNFQTGPQIDPNHHHIEGDTRIFVFGSNLQGMHGGGAAWYAKNKLGAEMGVPSGRTGQTYAIPTCASPGLPLTLTQVAWWIEEFLAHADHCMTTEPDTRFFVSPVGCGIAGFDEKVISLLFQNAPPNCDLPPGWRV